MKTFVDVILEIGSYRQLLLVDRASFPFGWALPGGFIDENESPWDAAKREVQEETGLEIELSKLFRRYFFCKQNGEITSQTFVFLARSVGGVCAAADDAKAVQVCSLLDLPELIPAHKHILHDYLQYCSSGLRPRSQIVLPSWSDEPGISQQILA